MQDARLYSLSAIFQTPDEIAHAAEQTVERGYTAFDVHSPYPLHGMPRAMGLKASKLGYVTLVFGLSGAALALFFMWWVNVIEYPLVIGGKPLFQLPAFIPVTFEVTVLMAAIFTVVGMLFVIFRFPNTSHPLHDTPYMKAVSSDKYGLTIQALDPLFDEERVREFLQDLGAVEIHRIQFDAEEIEARPRIFEPRFVTLLILVALLVGPSTYIILNHVLYMPPFDWMMEQQKINPQMKSELFADGFGMRSPVEGTVARGHLPYPFKGQPDLAGKFLVNPILPTESVLELGKKKYDTFCSPCHGNFGDGDSRLRGQFPNPPTLHSDKSRGWSDGMIFHVVTEGQNIMPSYASQIKERDRWAVVHYVRALLRAKHATEADLR